jgi:hypothetical protein
MGHISGLTEQPERLVVQTLPDTAYFAVSLCGGVAEFSLSKNCLRCRNGAEPRALVQKPSMRGRLGGKSTAGEHPEEAALFQCTEGPVGLDRWAPPVYRTVAHHYAIELASLRDRVGGSWHPLRPPIRATIL